MLTEKDYCDYETCVALKKLGFDKLVDWYFNEEKSIVSSLTRYRNTYIPRISLYEAQKWLREEKNIDISITISPFEYFATIREFVFWNGKYSFLTPPTYPNGAKTYEEALLEGIKSAVKILKEN